MQILYKGKSNTYVGECECGTVVMANELEIDFLLIAASHPSFVRCPICRSSFLVYKDGTELAKNIRTKYQKKQKEDNRRNASAFLDGLEENKEEREIKIKFDQLKQILEEYADKNNYYYQDHTSCTYEDAEQGLLLLEELKNSLTY